MRLFLDTNILLDVLTQRSPHYPASAEVWTLCEEGKVTGHISVISFNNIFYIARKLKNVKTAHAMIAQLRDIFRPVEFDEQLLNQAIGSNMRDFEDAIQLHSAIRCNADFLLTRNATHFPKAPFPILPPEQFLAAIAPPNQNEE